jgi:hypothetical protein
MFRTSVCLAAAAIACAVGQAEANTITINGSNGAQSASATFAFSNSGGQNKVDITLTNTMTANSNPGWLTGLFFDIAGAPTLTADAVAASMITLNGTTQTAYNDHTIGQFWAFRDGVNAGGPLNGQQYGLGCAGFGIFGPSDMIQGGGPNPQPDGSDGGIVGNFAGVSVPGGHEGRPLALGSVSFSFLLDSNFDVNNGVVDNVAFVFGTSLSEVVINGDGPPPPMVPVPMALPMAVAGLVGVGIYRRRSTKN